MMLRQCDKVKSLVCDFYNNKGVALFTLGKNTETVENLIEHISGYRPDEDSVLAIHSMLMGDVLTA